MVGPLLNRMILVVVFFAASLNTINSLSGEFFLSDGVFSDADNILAGFGDFNADKRVDIFALSSDGQSVDVWLANWDGGYSRNTIIQNNSTKPSPFNYIKGIVLTDFNGDGFLDVLCNKVFDKSTRLYIYWGSYTGLDNHTQIDMEISDEPILFDYNGDGLPDLLVEDLNKKKTVFLSMNNKTFGNITFPSDISLAVPHSSSFVNITPSANTDLVLTMSNGEYHVFSNNNYINFSSYKIEGESIGQSSFGDLNQDGMIDHIVPIGNKILVRFNNTWNLLGELEATYQFDYDNKISVNPDVIYDVPPTLIVGDYDSDGYLDLLTVVKNADRHVPALLKNVPCVQLAKCSSYGRSLDFQPLPDVPGNVQMASFYDSMEDGTLDILLTTITKNSSITKANLILLKNVIAADTCFLKVTVTNGLLETFPLHDHKPYGLNVPGATVFYETIKTNGGAQKSCMTQLTQSAHFSLQLPYVLFGLGQTPNFVEKVVVTLPHQHDKSVRSKQWTQITPNSQLLVNPHPLDEPLTWTMQLFVMPSRQIYTTAAVLGSTCVGLIFIVGGLFWKENKDDKAEKKQESHRFNFDAM